MTSKCNPVVLRHKCAQNGKHLRRHCERRHSRPSAGQEQRTDLTNLRLRIVFRRSLEHQLNVARRSRRKRRGGRLAGRDIRHRHGTDQCSCGAWPSHPARVPKSTRMPFRHRPFPARRSVLRRDLRSTRTALPPAVLSSPWSEGANRRGLSWPLVQASWTENRWLSPHSLVRIGRGISQRGQDLGTRNPASAEIATNRVAGSLDLAVASMNGNDSSRLATPKPMRAAR